MGEITIWIDGKLACGCRCDKKMAKAVLRNFPRLAASLGADPALLVGACLQHVYDDLDELTQQKVLNAFIWQVVSVKTNDPFFPGTIADHIGGLSVDAFFARRPPSSPECAAIYDLEVKARGSKRIRTSVQ